MFNSTTIPMTDDGLSDTSVLMNVYPNEKNVPNMMNVSAMSVVPVTEWPLNS